MIDPQTSSSETPKRISDLGQIAFKPSFTTRNRFPSPQAPLLTARPIYKPVMMIRATTHILAAMVEWGGVRIYSPCMSQHEGANISGGTCLMHGAMDVHWTLHSFHQTWKISAFLAYWSKCTNTLACTVQAAHSWSHSASTMTQSLSTFVHMCVWYREILGEYLGEIQVAPAAGHTVRAGVRLSQSIHVRTHVRRTYVQNWS